MATEGEKKINSLVDKLAPSKGEKEPPGRKLAILLALKRAKGRKK